MAQASPARVLAAEAVVWAWPGYPDMPLVALEELEGWEELSPADRGLATAIHRLTLRRLLTLMAVAGRPLSRPWRRVEPEVAAALLTGTAQLVFLDRTPGYAAIDESVDVVKALGRPGASGMVNAVLRAVTRVVDVEGGKQRKAWAPGDRALPLPKGRQIGLLEDGVLPELEGLSGGGDVKDLDKALSVACSLHRRVTKGWVQRLGAERATAMALHAIEEPPTVVTAEAGFDPAELGEAWKGTLRPHETAGFWVWDGPRERLRELLAGHAARRVQDVSSAETVDEGLAEVDASGVRRVLDLCAGRGAKTRQLALRFPRAEVWASDPDPARFADLEALTDELENVRAVPNEEIERVIEGAVPGGFDVVLLDVPCSNTGVLARRLEARYRYSEESLGGLVRLQREIGARGAGLCRDGGWVLYATCSVEGPENSKQAARLAREHGLTLLKERQAWPGGSGAQYRDGAYFALLQKG